MFFPPNVPVIYIKYNT